MSTYSVPGEWFEDVRSDEGLHVVPEDYDDLSYDDHDGLEAPPVVRRDTRNATELRAIAHMVLNGELTPEQIAADLRSVAADIERGNAAVSTAIEMLTESAQRPADPTLAEPSPTGNCKRCGTPLPLPSMGPGAPRKYCLTCGPRRSKRAPKRNIPGKYTQ